MQFGYPAFGHLEVPYYCISDKPHASNMHSMICIEGLKVSHCLTSDGWDPTSLYQVHTAEELQHQLHFFLKGLALVARRAFLCVLQELKRWQVDGGTTRSFNSRLVVTCKRIATTSCSKIKLLSFIFPFD